MILDFGYPISSNSHSLLHIRKLCEAVSILLPFAVPVKETRKVDEFSLPRATPFGFMYVYMCCDDVIYV